MSPLYMRFYGYFWDCVPLLKFYNVFGRQTQPNDFIVRVRKTKYIKMSLYAGLLNGAYSLPLMSAKSVIGCSKLQIDYKYNCVK